MPRQFPKLTALLVAAQLAGSAIAAAPHDDHHHHAFAQDVDAFHAVLAPLWHARPGKERSRNTCAKAKELASLAGNIRSADAKPLLASIASLDQQCRKAPADIDAAFYDVHEAFHRLAEPKGH